MVKYLRVFLFMFLILSNIFIIDIKDTNSRLFNENDKSLIYDTNLVKMTGSVNDSNFIIDYDRYTSSYYYDNLHYYIEFDRSGNSLANETDEYTLNLSNSCDVVNISADNGISNGNKITFTNEGTETIYAEIRCTVQNLDISYDDANDRYFDINVTEKFGNTEEVYSYIRHTESFNLDSYLSNFPESEDVFLDNYRVYIMQPDRNNKVSAITRWLGKYAETTNGVLKDSTAIKYVINSMNEIVNPGLDVSLSLNGSNITADTFRSFDSIEGLKVTVEDDGTYRFEIEDTFINIAKTYDYHGINQYYFHDVTLNEDIYNLFFDYIDKYIYLKDSTEYNYVKDFVDNNIEKDENGTMTESVFDMFKRLNIGISLFTSSTDVYAVIPGSNDLINYLHSNIGPIAYLKSYSQLRKSLAIGSNLTNLNVNQVFIDCFDTTGDNFNQRIADILAITDDTVYFDNYIVLTNTFNDSLGNEITKTMLVHLYSYDNMLNLYISYIDLNEPLELEYQNTIDENYNVDNCINEDLTDLGINLELSEDGTYEDGTYTAGDKIITISTDIDSNVKTVTVENSGL